MEEAQGFKAPLDLEEPPLHRTDRRDRQVPLLYRAAIEAAIEMTELRRVMTLLTEHAANIV
jgi:hypothetical protein